MLAFVRRALFRVHHVRARRRMQRTDVVRVFGFTLRVEPTVFHPALFRSTRLLARHLLCQDLTGRTVLDMGTGSGVAALCAARQGARATAVDVNPRAVACARANAAANGLADRVEVLESDLFNTIHPGTRFDLISWNPPFYPEQPSGAAELAWKAGPDYDVIAAFARAVPAFLPPGGVVLLVLSSDVDVPRLRRLFTDQGFAARTVRTSRGLFETLTLEELAVRSAE